MTPYKVIPEEYHCQSWFCKLWAHWLNPLGNWNEPLPYPKKRKLQAEDQWLPPAIWWAIRNPFHNFNHYWIGIVPRNNRYEWYKPEDNGWTRHENGNWSWWSKPWRLILPYYRVDGSWTFYFGWLSRGNFGIALRKN
jgi:hypothetical protein